MGASLSGCSGSTSPMSGGEVECERVSRHDAAVVRRDPDRFGLRDQVADGDDQAVVADHDAVALALGPQDRRGERIVGDAGRKAHDRVECARQVERGLRRIGLQRRRECPVGRFGHRGFDPRARSASGRAQFTPEPGAPRRPRDARPPAVSCHTVGSHAPMTRSTMPLNRQFRLAARPVGLPKPADWTFTEEPVPDAAEGTLRRQGALRLARSRDARLDERRASRTSRRSALGDVMRAGGVGRVVASKHRAFRRRRPRRRHVRRAGVRGQRRRRASIASTPRWRRCRSTWARSACPA